MRADRVRRACLLLMWLAAALPARAINGSIQVITFNGPVTGQPVTFSVYLPPGYASSTNRYPLVIHLHGLGGRHDSPQTNLVATSHEAAVAAGAIEPCIIAFPDAYTNSFWADSANSPKPAETNVRAEVIPYLDANFRTAGVRERRIIQGFSMGGFGAARFATKFPELFAACVVYDGALLTWPQIQQRHAPLASELFNNSSATFDQYSPWFWLTQNVSTLRATMRFRVVVGALANENRAWRDALLAESIAPDYVETGEPHSLGAVLDTAGLESWAFIARAMSNAASGFRVAIFRSGQDAVLRWNSRTGEVFNVLGYPSLATNVVATTVASNVPASGATTEFTHTNGLGLPSSFYRVARVEATSAPPSFTFDWTGTNFTYTDATRTFTGVMLKPNGNGPFPAVLIQHGAGGTAAGYSLAKAREMLPWGLVCIAPTLTHVAGGETNPVNMGFCPENLARATACLNVLGSLAYVDTNRLALFGHSMGAFATIGGGSVFGNRIRVVSISAGGIIPDSAGSTNAAPTVTEASGITAPMHVVHCDGDPVVPLARSTLLIDLLASRGVTHQRIVIFSNSIPNQAFWHNIHNDANANSLLLTNTRAWFQTHGVLMP